MGPMFLVLVLNVAGVGLSAYTRGRTRITAASHRAKILEWRRTTYRFPSVDVFLPSCGEPLAVLESTYRHVERLRWGGALEVYVLDDAASADVAELARHYGFHYVVRADRGRMKKAGNLSNAFGISAGDFIAIFDADFCPRPDFFEHLIPYADDRHVALVQSPQYFETTLGMVWLERTAGATQELFYRWVQPGRDHHGAAICVGTCAVYRRAALNEAGGFAQIEHSEDVHTGIAQLLRGDELRYVPAVVAAGLSPDDLAGFLNQQYRWCNGSMSLLGAGLPSPLLVSGPGGVLTPQQRICFWTGFLYYISTAVNVFTMHVPGIVMAGWYPQDIRAWHVLPFLPGLWVYFVLLPRVSHTRWRFEVIRTQMAYSFCHALAIIDKLRGTTKGWVATGSVKKGSAVARQVSIMGSVTIVATISAGLPLWYTAMRDYGIGELWSIGLFWILYLYLAVPLLFGFLGVLGLRPPAWLVSRGNNISVASALFYTVLIVAVGVLSTAEWWWR
jgi:cellulose synthase (UDP-forming)